MMISVLKFILFSLYITAFATSEYVDPEYLNMLRETGRHEEFAKLLGLEDPSLVIPLEGRTEEDLIYTTVSPLGDILLTPEQEEQARQGVNFMRTIAKKWDKHVVPYEIERGFDESDRAKIESGFKDLSDQLENIDIVPRTNEKDYVYVINGRGCYSNLGRTGQGVQSLSLQSNGCLRRGTIMHEMLHAMGIIHEQNRPDRDEYVTVIFRNIPYAWRSQYRKMSPKEVDVYGPYDPYSVMHYSYYAPGTNKPAFRFRDSNVDLDQVGQRVGLSDYDVQKAEALYST